MIAVEEEYAVKGGICLVCSVLVWDQRSWVAMLNFFREQQFVSGSSGRTRARKFFDLQD